MNRSALQTLIASTLLPGLMLMAGCPRNTSAVKELAEDQVAEALVTQTISSYNTSVSVAVNDHSVAMTCNTSGTVDFTTYESTGEICYQVDSRGCDFETGSGRQFSIEGTSTMCGEDDLLIDAETESLQTGQSYRLDGSATVSNADASRTCSYALDVTIDSVLGDGVTYNVSVSGTLCGNRLYAGSFEIDVDGNVAVTTARR